QAAPAPEPIPAPIAARTAGPFTTRCTVQENGSTRTFVVTLEPQGMEPGSEAAAAPAATTTAVAGGTPVYSTFAGFVEIVDLRVKVGDTVQKGNIVAQVEAMKATHDIRAPRDGKVTAIGAKVGDEIDSTRPILTIG
ncbi:MAG: acetyl-CoA carboxylase biotin carboxyl carrier protein subunit, partial [Gemmatimonadota bacterium]|nr:acetyl-CoA carboxylase biotin carboxyl carrier protein subunit [Gemmatimonadota bacterium]